MGTYSEITHIRGSFFSAGDLNIWVNMPWKPPVQEKCVRCTKSVYAAERMEAGGHIFHKLCFRCSECDMQLNLNSYNQADGILYCKNHFHKAVTSQNTQCPAAAT